MGSSKPTQEAVKGELETKLINSAVALLGLTSSSISDLKTALDKLAQKYFTGFFGYDYNENAQLVKPPNAAGRTTTVAHLVSIQGSDDSKAKDYINDVILKAVDVPDWVKTSTSNDILHFARRLSTEQMNDTWSSDKYTQTFDPTKEDKNTKSMRADAALVYVNASLTKDGVGANICVVYYMAAYYEIASKTTVAREQLRTDAFSEAKSLQPGSNITTTLQLRDALGKYSAEQFKKTFNFDYDTKSPPEFPPHVSSAIKKGSYELKYFQDNSELAGDDGEKGTSNAGKEATPNEKKPTPNEEARLRGFVKDEYFNTLDFTDSAIRAQCEEDLSNQLVKFGLDNRGGQWGMETFDRRYEPKNPAVNAMRACGIILHFCKWDKSPETGEKIFITYAFIFGSFYEVENQRDIVVRDLFSQLVLKLAPNAVGGTDLKALTHHLSSYAKDAFKGEFGFDWNGAQTNVPDPGAGTMRKPFSVLLDLGDFPLKLENIQRRVGLAIFRKTPFRSDLFPSSEVQAAFFDDLIDAINDLTNDDVEENIWRTQFRTPAFPVVPTKPDSHLVKQYTTLVYSIGNNSEGTIGVKRVFLYYLTVFYGVPPMGGNVW